MYLCMYVYVCICMCMYVCMCIYIYVYALVGVMLHGQLAVGLIKSLSNNEYSKDNT